MNFMIRYLIIIDLMKFHDLYDNVMGVLLHIE